MNTYCSLKLTEKAPENGWDYNYFPSFWGYVQGRHTLAVSFGFFFRCVLRVRRESSSHFPRSFIVWELLRPLQLIPWPTRPLAVLCQPGPSGVVTSSWRARRTCQLADVFGKFWEDLGWRPVDPRNPTDVGKYAIFTCFYQGFWYLNWFRSFLPPLAWFGNWWDQHKMSKTSIVLHLKISFTIRFHSGFPSN